MIDPGRLFAEAIYFLQFALAQIMWAVNRAALSIAVIAESVNTWLTDNVGYLVELLVNGLSAPLSGMFILALTALGLWYTLNNVVPTSRWVDPGKLLLYGLIAFSFFSSPILVIDMMEDLRTALNAGIDQALLAGAEGNIFDSNMNGTDPGLAGAIPDVNSDGVIGSFDLVTAFMLVANIDELDSSEFPVDFEATFFPFGDPSSIDLSDEADQELAKALANDGLERLFFSFVAIPTAIAEHFLRLALTGVAMFLYTGAPIAMVFAFFVYTQAFLGAYLRQFINLLIETLMSVIITAILLSLLLAAAQQGIGLYIGASFLVFIVLLWRIKSALKLASAAIDLFGGSLLTGGAGGMALAQTGQQVLGGTLGLVGAAVTGGATLAAGGAVLASAAALQADGRNNGAYLGTDPDKTDGRVKQLKTIAGYTLGRSETTRRIIEGAHEARTLARNFRDGEVQSHDPDMLDYLRAGSAMSGFGSSPWLAMRTSPSLRAAFDEIGGSRTSYRDAAFDGDGEPVDQAALTTQYGMPVNGRSTQSLQNGSGQLHDSLPEEGSSALWPEEPANGPLPEWLRDEPFPAQNGAQGSDRNTPLHDVRGSGDLTSSSNSTTADMNSGRNEKPEPLSTGAVRLEPYEESRQQIIAQTLARLEDPHSLAGQAAQKTLVTYTGQGNAQFIQEAVGQHTAAAVQEVVTVTADLVTQYRTQGMDDATVLAAFQSGEATTAIRGAVSAKGAALPLSDEQLSAVADMVLLPQRRLTRGELVVAIGREAAAGAQDERPVIRALGMPINFGGLTGNVRGVLAGAQSMNLSSADLTRLAQMIQDGLRDVVQAELADRGHRPEVVRHFVSDMAALPGAMVVPQSAAVDKGGATAVSGPQPQEE